MEFLSGGKKSSFLSGVERPRFIPMALEFQDLSAWTYGFQILFMFLMVNWREDPWRYLGSSGSSCTPPLAKAEYLADVVYGCLSDAAARYPADVKARYPVDLSSGIPDWCNSGVPCRAL
ncbi:hypothetical protein QYF36_026821 [Acer negundo]|nr:hypothetical protein QYF36_026821 [Acer negundo]